MELWPHHKLRELWQVCIQEMLWINTLETEVGWEKAGKFFLFPSDKLEAVSFLSDVLAGG